VSSSVIFQDKNAGETLTYEVEFDDRLLNAEYLIGAFVGVLLFSGVDPNPSTMLVGSPILNATATGVIFQLQLGLPGCIYIVVVTGNSGTNYYMKTGHLAVVASDPFASL
jgi:hypothetical protein